MQSNSVRLRAAGMDVFLNLPGVRAFLILSARDVYCSQPFLKYPHILIVAIIVPSFRLWREVRKMDYRLRLSSRPDL